MMMMVIAVLQMRLMRPQLYVYMTFTQVVALLHISLLLLKVELLSLDIICNLKHHILSRGFFSIDALSLILVSRSEIFIQASHMSSEWLQ